MSWPDGMCWCKAKGSDGTTPGCCAACAERARKYARAIAAAVRVPLASAPRPEDK